MEIFKPQIFDFAGSSALFNQLENDFIDKILDFNTEEGVVRVCLSGGTTPLELYSRMAKNVALPWEQVEFFQSDERYIKPDSPDSNQFNIKQSFGQEFCQELKEINFFETNLPIEMTVKNYNEKLDSLDGKLFDLTVLGVGPDGHIASLFPGSNYLGHQSQPVIETVAPPEFAVSRRISLTIEALLDSKEIFLVITGANKHNVLKEMLEGELKAVDFPVKFLLAHPKLTIYNYIEVE